ncbi:MAG: MarR family winged helix-turn-helix transcriptional regulator [Candidatus Paceibacterota bacterium]|jgi:DNA-binding MarR family transcriptional regulator
MPTRTTSSIDRDLVSTLIAIKHIAVEQFRMHRANTGTPFLAFQTLHYIDTRRTATMKDIAHLFCITPPSATSLVKTLLKQKLVTQKTDTHDRRKTILMVTPTGARMLAQEGSRMANNITKVFSVLSARDRVALIKILRMIVAAHTTK